GTFATDAPVLPQEIIWDVDVAGIIDIRKETAVINMERGTVTQKITITVLKPDEDVTIIAKVADFNDEAKCVIRTLDKDAFWITENPFGTGYIIKGPGGLSQTGTTLYIPDIINDIPVTQIDANAFRDLSTLITKIILPKSITYIGLQAFMGSSFSNLVTIESYALTPPILEGSGLSDVFNKISLVNIYVPIKSIKLYRIGWNLYEKYVIGLGQYRINVQATDGGVIVPEEPSATPGMPVILNAVADEGKEIDLHKGIEIVYKDPDNDSKEISETYYALKFIMPVADISIFASFKLKAAGVTIDPVSITALTADGNRIDVARFEYYYESDEKDVLYIDVYNQIIDGTGVKNIPGYQIDGSGFVVSDTSTGIVYSGTFEVINRGEGELKESDIYYRYKYPKPRSSLYTITVTWSPKITRIAVKESPEAQRGLFANTTKDTPLANLRISYGYSGHIQDVGTGSPEKNQIGFLSTAVQRGLKGKKNDDSRPLRKECIGFEFNVDANGNYTEDLSKVVGRRQLIDYFYDVLGVKTFKIIDGVKWDIDQESMELYVVWEGQTWDVTVHTDPLNKRGLGTAPYTFKFEYDKPVKLNFPEDHLAKETFDYFNKGYEFYGFATTPNNTESNVLKQNYGEGTSVAMPISQANPTTGSPQTFYFDENFNLQAANEALFSTWGHPLDDGTSGTVIDANTTLYAWWSEYVLFIGEEAVEEEIEYVNEKYAPKIKNTMGFYEIWRPSELMHVSLRTRLSESNFIQMKDIKLNPSPVNPDDKDGLEMINDGRWQQFRPISGIEGFGGTYNGNGFKIKNIYISEKDKLPSVGFFGTANPTANISNVIIENGLIEIDSTNGTGIGGIVGSAKAETARAARISHSINRALIRSNISNTGGVIGFYDGLISDATPLIRKLGNEGKIEVKGATSINIGGVIGTLAIQSSASILVEYLYNTAFISSDTSGTGAGNRANMGGLIGFLSSGNTLSISLSYNTGSLTSANSGFIGGIVGGLSNNAIPGGLSLRNVYNRSKLITGASNMSAAVADIGSRTYTLKNTYLISDFLLSTSTTSNSISIGGGVSKASSTGAKIVTVNTQQMQTGDKNFIVLNTVRDQDNLPTGTFTRCFAAVDSNFPTQGAYELDNYYITEIKDTDKIQDILGKTGTPPFSLGAANWSYNPNLKDVIGTGSREQTINGLWVLSGVGPDSPNWKGYWEN
ncbi:MAG: hypothetical protein ACRC5H_04420, partial [Treponemataceae bacterium]